MMAKDEEIDPSFAHLDGAQLPVVKGEGKTARVVAGRLLGARSPLQTTSETLFVDVSLDAGATMPLDAGYEERAIYLESGETDVAGGSAAAGCSCSARRFDNGEDDHPEPSRHHRRWT